MREEQHTKFDTVMIIDDNAIDLYVTSRMILKNNFSKKVLEFSLAQNALQYLQDNQNNTALLPQVLLVDIYMPMMSGFEFMEAYDKLPDTFKNNSKTYIVSSSLDENDISRAKNDRNITAFHEKPVNKDFLDSIGSSSL